MRSIPNKALALVVSAMLLIAGCSSDTPISKETGNPSPQSTLAPDPGTYNDEEVQALDTGVCEGLQTQAAGINQKMKDRQDGNTSLEELRSALETFLDEDASSLVQTSQTASDSLIPQDAEDFVLTVKFLEGYIQNGGEVETQTVAITDNNEPALETLEGLDPVEAFQLQVAATESIEEEELARADGEEYEHRIFGACYTLGIDVTPNAYNLHFTQETNV